jgi:hypothetical protein
LARAGHKSLWCVGTDGKDRFSLVKDAELEFPSSSCISPDGQFLAVSFVTFVLGDDGKPDPDSAAPKLAILDMKGRELRTLSVAQRNVFLIDWRDAL